MREIGYNVVIESVEHNTISKHNNHVGFASTNVVAGALKKVGWAHGLTAPVLVVEMFGLSITIPLMAGLSILEWLVVIFSTVVILIIGWQFHRGMWQQLTHGTANMDSLISVGTLAAWGLSMWELLNGGARYFETGAVIVALILLGKYLEAKSRGQASEAIRKLMEYGAKQARVVRNEVEVLIDVSSVKIGELVRVKPGEKLPLDGQVVDGASSIDESMLTGESIPVEKISGSDVFAGTLNQHGVLLIQVTKENTQSVLAQITRLVAEAQGSKAPIQKLADKISGLFVPVVVVIALVTFSGWYYVTGDISQSILVAVSVLVIACPCALGLATPTAIMVGTGLAATRGILIKNGEALERAHKISTMVFDKTGTLTSGHPQVTDIVAVTGIKVEELLALAASLESASEHPLAEAIVAEAKIHAVDIMPVNDFKAEVGKGVRGVVGGKICALGNIKLMSEVGATPLIINQINDLESQGKTVVHLSCDGVYIGSIAVADMERPNAKRAVAELLQLKIQVAMISGDNRRTAEAVAKRLGITQVIAEVLPPDKAREVQKLQATGVVVGFVGDGLNDAPALAQADLGIAVGTGTDIAKETGSIVLVQGNPLKVVEALTLSRRIFRTIKQNLFWAFAYNVIGIPLAALGLLSPMIAAGAMAFSSVFVVGNSLRLKNFR